jgi:hypothetical protein
MDHDGAGGLNTWPDGLVRLLTESRGNVVFIGGSGECLLSQPEHQRPRQAKPRRGFACSHYPIGQSLGLLQAKRYQCFRQGKLKAHSKQK